MAAADGSARGRLVARLASSSLDCTHLLKHGYQVFPSCLSAGQADEIRAALDADVTLSGEHFPPDRVGRHGSGHWQSVWRAREATDALFWRLFGEQPLHAFDGFAHTVSGRQNNKLWLHVDQPASNANAFDSLQGLLALSDVPEDGYATALCHSADVQALRDELHHAGLGRGNQHGPPPDTRVHFYTAQETEWLLARSALIRPRLRKGSLLVWCAGVPHCAYGHAWARRAVFVSAIPRSLCHDDDELEMRRDAARRGLTSNLDVVCRAAGGANRLSLRGGDQSWPKRFAPMESYDEPTSARQQRRAGMIGFDHTEGGGVERATGGAVVLLDALIAHVSHAEVRIRYTGGLSVDY